MEPSWSGVRRGAATVKSSRQVSHEDFQTVDNVSSLLSSPRFPLSRRSHLLAAASRLDENGKVSDLVRHFVQQDGDGGDVSDGTASQKRGADGQPIRQVVREIRRQVQISRHFDVA